MSTPHAILIALLEKPSSGYDLARRFDRAIGYFWHATHQQIYRELGRMVESGWVAVDEEGAAAGLRKKVYYVLPAGREEVVRWVRDTEVPVDERYLFLLKLRADAAIGPLGIEEGLRRLVEGHRERLAVYRAIEQRDFGAPTLSRSQQLQYAILRAGIRTEEGWLEWMADVKLLIENEAK